MNEPRHLDDCDGNGTIPCWECGGVGGYHNCGEDTCSCADDGELTQECVTCEGRGFIVCPACYTSEVPPEWSDDPGDLIGGGFRQPQ